MKEVFNADVYFDDLVQNAIDFMNKSLEELDNNDLKHSVINFYTSVELFFKARLLKEHWSLIVEKDPDIKKFITGNFISVSFNTIVKRLKDVLGFDISAKTISDIDNIRQHRNKMVHFFHSSLNVEKDKDEIVSHLMTAWASVNHILTEKWDDIFIKFSALKSMHIQLFNTYNPYVQRYYNHVYENKKDFLTGLIKKGYDIKKCDNCNQISSEIKKYNSLLTKENCHVCKNEYAIISTTCPNCKQKINSNISIDSYLHCQHCNSSFNGEDFFDSLQVKYFDKDGYSDHYEISCCECNSYHSIIKLDDIYFCIMCLATFQDFDIEQCDYCGEHSTNVPECSGFDGCDFCDGNTKLKEE